MSGFEIAGVVLGSIPLVIAALEHYADGVGMRLLWSKGIANQDLALHSQKYAKIRGRLWALTRLIHHQRLHLPEFV